MSVPVLASKRCPRCGEAKPVSDFYRNRRTKDGLAAYCKVCARAIVDAASEKRRAEMGDDAYLAMRRDAVKASRKRRGYARERLWDRARNRAVAELIDAHRAEYDARLQVALYEVEREEAS